MRARRTRAHVQDFAALPTTCPSCPERPELLLAGSTPSWQLAELTTALRCETRPMSTVARFIAYQKWEMAFLKMVLAAKSRSCCFCNWRNPRQGQVADARSVRFELPAQGARRCTGAQEAGRSRGDAGEAVQRCWACVPGLPCGHLQEGQPGTILPLCQTCSALAGTFLWNLQSLARRSSM